MLEREFEVKIKPIRDALMALIASSEALRVENHGTPSPMSKAAAEAASTRELADGNEIWGDPLEQAYDHGQLLLVSAEDFCKSACRLFEQQNIPIFGHVVLMRSALEHASRSIHLLDPALPARTRAIRMINERLFSFYEQIRMPEQVGETSKTKGRIDALLDEARRLRIPISGSKAGHQWLEGPRESATRLVKQLFADPDGGEQLGAVLYSYSSAVAHGAWFGLRQSVGRAPSIGTFEEKDRALFTSAQGVIGTLTTMYLSLSATYVCRDGLFGWSSDAWRKAQQETLKVAQSEFSSN